jgi:tetratricopeptide (TPR) repeat protein
MADVGDLDVHRRIGTPLIDELTVEAFVPTPAARPSQLLDAANRVVRFTGRRRELADLTAWRDDDPAMAVRLVHGDAGQGKTRLAHRFAELSRASGWITLRARPSPDIAVRPVATDDGGLVTAGRILVVVDDADRWPLTDLLALLVDRRLHGRPALRVLLLGRTPGNWWHGLTDRLDRSLGPPADTVELTPDDSGETYAVARSCFAAALRVDDPGGSFPRIGGSVLTVHMAALAAVLGIPSADHLLSAEKGRWPETIGRAAFVAALTGPLDRTAAAAALRSAGVDDGVLDQHAACYPPRDPATRLEPIACDRLAEDLVAARTPRTDAGVLSALADRHAATVFRRLAEAARRRPELVESALVPLLRRRPERAAGAGSPALAAIAAVDLPADVLAAVESALPAEPPPDLHAGVAAITERLAAGSPGPAAGSPGPAAAWKLGWRLLDTGRIPDALNLFASARRRATNPTQLEFALRSLGHAHLRARDWPAAATALTQAVSLWTDRNTTPPPDEAARCLDGLGLALGHQGRDAASLSARQRAITRLRRLIAVDGRHRLTLVRVLVPQAEQLRRAGRHRDALATLDEAASLLRSIAGAGLETDFAAALLGRARTLQSMRQPREAAYAVAGALRVLRQLAGLNIAYDHDLARALEVSAEIQAALENWRDAIGDQDRAVSIYRRLHRINRDRYGLDLAGALIAFARRGRDAQRRPRDTLSALTEAMTLLRSGRHDPAAADRLIAMARTVGADLLDAAGRRTEADDLRRTPRSGRPRPSGPGPVPSEADRSRARSLTRASPSGARTRLGKLASQDIAATLVVMTPRPDWLELMFHGFAPHRALAILRWMVRYEVAAGNPVILGFISDQLVSHWGKFSERADGKVVPLPAEVLSTAAPLVAAAILNDEVWTDVAGALLRSMPSPQSSRIIPLLTFRPDSSPERRRPRR